MKIAFLVLSLAVLRQEVLGASNVACEGYQCKNECVTAGCGKNCKGQECAKMCAANNCGQNCYGFQCAFECTGASCGKDCGSDNPQQSECAYNCKGAECGMDCAGAKCAYRCGRRNENVRGDLRCGKRCTGDHCAYQCKGNGCGEECHGKACAEGCFGQECGKKCSSGDDGDRCAHSCEGARCGLESSGPESARACKGTMCGMLCDGKDCAKECVETKCGYKCKKTSCAERCQGRYCGSECHDKSCAKACVGDHCGRLCQGVECAMECKSPERGDGQCGRGCVGKHCAKGCNGKWCARDCEGEGCAQGCIGFECARDCKGANCADRCQGTDCAQQTCSCKSFSEEPKDNEEFFQNNEGECMSEKENEGDLICVFRATTTSTATTTTTVASTADATTTTGSSTSTSTSTSTSSTSTSTSSTSSTAATTTLAATTVFEIAIESTPTAPTTDEAAATSSESSVGVEPTEPGFKPVGNGGADDVQNCNNLLKEQTGDPESACLNNGECKMKRSNCSDPESPFNVAVCDCGGRPFEGGCFYGTVCSNRVESCPTGTKSCNVVKGVKAGKDPAPIVCSTDVWPKKLCTIDEEAGTLALNAVDAKTNVAGSSTQEDADAGQSTGGDQQGIDQPLQDTSSSALTGIVVGLVMVALLVGVAFYYGYAQGKSNAAAETDAVDEIEHAKTLQQKQMQGVPTTVANPSFVAPMSNSAIGVDYAEVGEPRTGNVLFPAAYEELGAPSENAYLEPSTSGNPHAGIANTNYEPNMYLEPTATPCGADEATYGEVNPGTGAAAPLYDQGGNLNGDAMYDSAAAAVISVGEVGYSLAGNFTGNVDGVHYDVATRIGVDGTRGPAAPTYALADGNVVSGPTYSLADSNVVSGPTYALADGGDDDGEGDGYLAVGDGVESMSTDAMYDLAGNAQGMAPRLDNLSADEDVEFC